MLARGPIARRSSQWLKSSSINPSSLRTFASVTNPFTYQLSDTSGLKVVSKDTGSPTSSLAVVVKAGSRYENAPGVAHALEHYGFKNTLKRSALYITRESEMLGGVLETSLSRENIVYKARFLRDDLPYFVELLSDVITKTKFSDYELVERISPTLNQEIERAYSDPMYIALEAAHGIAFHHGLGLDKMAVVRRYLSVPTIKAYADKAFVKENFAIVGSGIDHSDLTKYAGDFFSDAKSGSALSASSSHYYGGESRNWSPNGNALVIAFPGSGDGPHLKPEFTVLSYLLGGEPTIKWSPGNGVLNQALQKYPGIKVVSKHLNYADVGLLYVGLSGKASTLKDAGSTVVEAINSLANVKEEDVKRAIMIAKFDILSAAEENAISMELVGQSAIASGKLPQIEDTIKGLEGVSLDTIKKAAKALLGAKPSVGTVGDLHALPYAEEIGLKV